jgi:hypothetical protein
MNRRFRMKDLKLPATSRNNGSTGGTKNQKRNVFRKINFIPIILIIPVKLP